MTCKRKKKRDCQCTDRNQVYRDITQCPDDNRDSIEEECQTGNCLVSIELMHCKIIYIYRVGQKSLITIKLLPISYFLTNFNI